MDIRRSLYANCVLSGGTTLLPQFGERVRAGLELLAPK
jgi:actin-related protein